MLFQFYSSAVTILFSLRIELGPIYAYYILNKNYVFPQSAKTTFYQSQLTALINLILVKAESTMMLRDP